MERMNKEELKKLKDFKLYVFEGDVYVKAEDYKKIAIENKKLNIKVASLEGEIKGLNSVIEKLKEENQTLELWLDNKEKLNEKYRKEIDNKKLSTIAEETIQDLQARIKELNEDIKKIEKNQEYRYHRCMKAERGGEDED